MTAHFADDAAVDRVGLGLLDRTLPKDEWTHAAHFAAALWLLRHRPDWSLEAAMPDIIAPYNVASGGENTDSAGYHHTITLASIAMARSVLAAHAERPLHEVVDALMASPWRSDWLLAHWSKDVLFSVAARRGWVAPDLTPLAGAR